MATGPMGVVIHHLRRSAHLQQAAAMTDGQELECFVSRRDEAAFEALVRRHGPMVLGVCRRVLGNHHDAEDAFQATFLVLVRKAPSLLKRDTIGNWLYGVAYRTALKAQAMASLRRAKERQAAQMVPPAAPHEDVWHDVQPLLDQELSQLPAKYREPIVLCDLEGKTRKETAQQLGWPEGTVATRLTRGRALLAKRLTRRGLELSGGALSTLMAQGIATASVPPALVNSTTHAVCLFATGEAMTAGLISNKVAVLAAGVLRAMSLSKLKTLALLLVVGGAFATGLGAVSSKAWTPGVVQASAQDQAPSRDQVPTPSKAVQNADQPADKAAVERAKAHVDKCAAELKRLEQLFDQGAVSAALLDSARAQLAEAEFQLAVAEKNTPAAVRHLHNWVQEREDKVGRFKQMVDRGAMSQQVLEQATIDLAEARILEGLYTILMLRENALARLQKLFEDGAVAESVLRQARQNLEEIRQRIQTWQVGGKKN